MARKKKQVSDETIELLIQIRDEIRAMLRSLREALPPKPLAPAELAITPELDAAIEMLHQSTQELRQTCEEEFGWRREPSTDAP